MLSDLKNGVIRLMDISNVSSLVTIKIYVYSYRLEDYNIIYLRLCYFILAYSLSFYDSLLLILEYSSLPLIFYFSELHMRYIC